MPKYNLEALGHEEFERLCQSLIQQIIGAGAKVYGMGSDGSREATFKGKAPYPSKEEQWGGSWIFQAKFHDVQQIGPKEARRRLLVELDDELSKITEKYKHPCDNFILMTNVSLTPAFQKGIKDRIDNEIIPKYHHVIKHIHVWGAEEICRFLDDYPGIRQTYAHLLVSGDIIARLLRLIEREETDLDELVKLYCQGCLDHEKYAALDDAGDVEDERIALQRVFIDLDAKPPRLPQDPQALERLPEWLKQAADDERSSALSYLLDDSIPGLVLIGGPGEGKSTLGQYLAQIHRARLIGRLNELEENIEEFEKCIPRIPFRILLREYAQWVSSRNNSDSLFHYLAHHVSQVSGRDVNPEHIHKIIKSNPVLLILDGLDEVPEKKLRRRVLDNITSFVHQVKDILKGNLRVIATTRPYGYSQEFDPAHYLHLTLQKLSSEKASLYARRWTDAREPNPREANRIQKTFNMCLKDRVVNVLTQTPLQVTILLVIIRARGTPPKQREELFERYMDIIYQREQKKRPELLRTEQDITYGLHKYLAYILHRRAEKDETAALMDVSEFRKRVKEYLHHTNPLLSEEELETKTEQIIREASQRLVLIESPQEGKIGFGLTTTREFFAAAHLVDTAKDTKERDLRFRAIARSPHWRNVALFFAGRVGRTRPGEAASMIDVCREIDTEMVDKFLKRGAELVMEMVDDRVLREPHNEVGAIQYGLTMLDNGYIRAYGEFLNKLKNLPDEYKERVVCPWMEERLKNIIPENLKLYADIYQKLFGIRGPLKTAIQRASKFDSKDVKLWALFQAIKNRIVEPWVIELLEELVNIMSTERIARTLGNYWPNFRFYLNFLLSPKARAAIALALLVGIKRHSSPFEPLPPKVMEELSMIKPEGKFKKNSLLLWVVGQFIMLSCLSVAEERRYRRRDGSVGFSLPGIANPYVRAMINKNASFIKDFCETFSEQNEPFIKSLVTIFQFLLEPHKSEKYIAVSKQLQGMEKPVLWPMELIPRLPPDGEEEAYNYHKDLYTLYQLYESEEQYRKDFEELNELINKKSNIVTNHPQKLLVWIESHCDPTIEKFLDREILIDLKKWLRQRDLSENTLALCSYSWRRVVSDDFELCKLVLEIVNKQLAKGQKWLTISPDILFYEWHEPKTEQELAVANRLRQIFEKVLDNYSILKDPYHRQLEILYWSALRAGVAEEKHMTKLYKIVHEIADFPSIRWYVAEAEKVWSTLLNLLQSENLEVSRLSAVSLSVIPQARKKIKEVWIGDKYWNLAQDKKDAWRPRYINGMAQCQLKWAENGQEWLEAIKETNTEEVQRAWCRVIEEAGYNEAEDLDALFNLLLHILESRDTFARPVRFAALRRLYEIVSEIEPVEFDEESLNLPLSRRGTTSFS
ncbi:MAG TPA: hypothetical protein ENH14_02635 [candidate division WOR-3 bacterium]|uniref:NACHT domain-containing protein n=1 Tax=candidate division WOR-3 bacterium TaxID=2052148 RepID=A0A7V0LUE6_UNCW3|nr:hypothetical protein [candidate division WOR-3 bacterium]